MEKINNSGRSVKIPRALKKIKIESVDIEMPINKKEVFDVDNMEGLLRSDGISEEEKKSLRKYKRNARNGNEVSVTYDFSETNRQYKKGRLYPTDFNCLTTFKKEIRAALAAKFYDEFDCENSQPVLLSQIAKRKDIPCPALCEYVEKRKEVLESLQQTHKIDRQDAKDICIAVLFGGYHSEHPLLPRIKEELDILAARIASDHSEFLELARLSKAKKGRSDNIISGALAHYAQNEERTVLLCICDFLESKDYSVDVLSHDGGNVKKKNEETISMTVLEEAQAVVLDKLGYAITLTLKPLTHSFDFTKKDSIFVSPKIMVDDSFAATKFVGMVGDKIRRCGGELYVLNDEGFWEANDDAIRNLISQYEERLVWKQYNSIGMVVTFNYGGDVNKIAKLITQTKVKAKISLLPLQMTHLMTVSDRNNHSEEVSLFLELLHLVCGKNQILTTYVQKWLAHGLQKPYELPGVMLIVSGGKGVGKDTTFDFIGKHIYGKFSAINYVNNKQFWEKHDTGRKGKFFIKLEEADRKTCIDNAQALKGLITGESIIYNGKNEKPVSVPNYCRFVFTTNKGNPVDFSEAERRFVILPCAADKKGDSAFWCKVREALFNDQAGKAVADFLLKIDLTDFDVRKLPENTYQADVVEAAESPEQRFVAQWDGEEVSATAFYLLYRDFCIENDFRYAENQTRFGNLMLTFIRDRLVIKDRGCKGICYKK